MVSVFSAATKTPIASSVMAAELFGWKFGLLAIPACLASQLLSGKKSIYH
jgi:H+/Cl- antiporter ClcA